MPPSDFNVLKNVQAITQQNHVVRRVLLFCCTLYGNALDYEYITCVICTGRPTKKQATYRIIIKVQLHRPWLN